MMLDEGWDGAGGDELELDLELSLELSMELACLLDSLKSITVAFSADLKKEVCSSGLSGMRISCSMFQKEGMVARLSEYSCLFLSLK